MLRLRGNITRSVSLNTIIPGGFERKWQDLMIKYSFKSKLIQFELIIKICNIGNRKT